MTSLLKNSQNAAKVSSTKIFIKTMEILNLTNYQSIEKLDKEGCETSGQITCDMDSSGIFEK